jgi:two-component system, NarL family, response regulator DevR
MSDNQASLPRAAVVLDPHPLCHEGLRSLLSRLGIAVVGASRSPAAALALLRQREPDLLVAEIETPDGPAEGVEFVRSARERHPDLAIVVLSARAEQPVVEMVLAAGATTFVPKVAQSDEIAEAVRGALAPAIYLVSATGEPVESTTSVVGRRTIRIPTPAGGVARLTRRELEVLRLVEGRSNRQVAKVLWITDETVKFHLANIYRKLGVSSRAEAVEWARTSGLLEPASEEAFADLVGARVPIAGAWGGS